MTPNQVERVARAFYATEHSGDWDEAPPTLQEEFRGLARTAISLVQRQTAHGLSSLIAAEASDAASRTGIAEQRWRYSRVTDRWD
ncbi:hypothetical protein [Microvirga lotononidis]|uniref:Uncharacterized protein n=1 Tax=Microvirga lotononidis TaxID=864069 RepID=I4Z2M3_9HYPH|nr:hypothetical protein [Microvirga lotononidis]EIM30465.1 hypothetical protein MicloDRAFT_00007140 [Microvirga lotononidis]WQO26305.1 hypothetical protein U0023_16600 [Microvirga lotononidis]